MDESPTVMKTPPLNKARGSRCRMFGYKTVYCSWGGGGADDIKKNKKRYRYLTNSCTVTLFRLFLFSYFLYEHKHGKFTVSFINFIVPKNVNQYFGEAP